jgi:hypothetical protein
MEIHHAINGKIHYKWPCAIAMLNYQRVFFEILKATIQHLWNSQLVGKSWPLIGAVLVVGGEV